MAHSRRDQAYLGIDTNVLVAYLDGDHPAHRRAEWLSGEAVVLNPTVIHEAYHTLVFERGWLKEDASEALVKSATDERNLFVIRH